MMKMKIKDKKHNHVILRTLSLINNLNENIVRNTVILSVAGAVSGTVFRIISDFPGPDGEFMPDILNIMIAFISVSLGIPFILGTVWLIFAGLFFMAFSFVDRELYEEYFDGGMTETASFGINTGIMTAGLIDGFMFAAFFSLAGIFVFAASIIIVVAFVMIVGSPGEID